jgi:redox-sensitive bicupin YhaK (pirin superfamily)
MLKWVASQKAETRTLKLEHFRITPLAASETTSDSTQQAFALKECFSGPTDQLKRLHSHVTTLLPGGGYDTHTDEHDVAIILFEGTVETNGQHITPSQLVWHRAGIDHDMWNRSDAPARYLVIEFHGENCSGDYASYTNPKHRSKKSRYKKRSLQRILKNLKRFFGIRES